MVHPPPLFWKESQALNLPDILRKIREHHPTGHTVPCEMIAVIFFEETGFCNRQQVTKGGGKGPGNGFGQLQIYDRDKIPFFETLGFNSDRYDKKSKYPLITPGLITGNNDLAVKIHCKYFQWLVRTKGLSLKGALGAQTGGGANKSYIPLFIEGTRLLKNALHAISERKPLIDALNYARAKGFHKNPILADRYEQYWEFTIPDEFLILGSRH